MYSHNSLKQDLLKHIHNLMQHMNFYMHMILIYYKQHYNLEIHNIVCGFSDTTDSRDLRQQSARSDTAPCKFHQEMV